MPLIEAARDVLAASIELKSTMSNALCDTEHIYDAKDCRNIIATPTRDRNVRQPHWPRETSVSNFARREAKERRHSSSTSIQAARRAILLSSILERGHLTMRLSDVRLRRLKTKLIYLNHRLPPWLTEDATRDRSNRLLDDRVGTNRCDVPTQPRKEAQPR